MGTCYDEYWVLYVSDESLYFPPETNTTLYVNQAHLNKIRKKLKSFATCNNMEGPGVYYAKQSKSIRERQLSYDFIHMRNLRTKTDGVPGWLSPLSVCLPFRSGSQGPGMEFALGSLLHGESACPSPCAPHVRLCSLLLCTLSLKLIKVK